MQTGALGDDGFAEMEVYEPGRGKFGGFVGKCSVEGALVVVVSVLGRVVFAADVYDGVAVGKEGWVTGSEKGTGVISGEEAEEVDCQSFVGVEVTIVGANEGRGGFDTFGCWRGGHFKKCAKHSMGREWEKLPLRI